MEDLSLTDLFESKHSDGLIRLSPTSLNTYLRCGLQYKYRYIDGEIAPPRLRLLQGKHFEKGIAKDARSKKDTGQLMPLEALKDYTRDSITKDLDETQRIIGLDADDLLNPDDPSVIGKTIDETINATVVYHNTEMPAINPVDIEAKTEFEVTSSEGDQVKVLGFADIIEENQIIENKLTRRKSPATKYLAQNLTYQIGFGKPGVLKQTVLLKSGIKIHTDKIESDENSLNMMAERYLSVAKAIQSGNFIPTGDATVCSWCGYRFQCSMALK